MKRNTKLIASGAICPYQPKKKSTDNKQAEHFNDNKLHFEILYLQLMKLLRVSYLEHKTNDWVRSKISFLVDPQEPLLATVKRGKPAWFVPVTRHDNLSKTILQGTLEGGQRRDCRGNAGWTTPKRRHPCLWQNCSQGSSAEKTGI